MSRDPKWLTEPVKVPRGIALIFIALGTLLIVNGVLGALLWIFQR